LGFVLLVRGTDYVAHAAPALIWAWSAAVYGLAAALAFAGMPRAPFLRRFLRGSALFLMIYFATEDFSMPRVALAEGHPALLFHEGGRWVGLGLAMSGWFRPSALAAAALHLVMMRNLNGVVTGFYFSDLDVRAVAEVIAFVAIGFALLGVIRRFPRLAHALGLSDEALAARAGVLLLAAGVGAHLGNYFWSGLAKLALDGGPLSWLPQNRLSDGLPGAVEKGVYPFASWPRLGQWVHDVVRAANLPIQAAGLALQLGALAAPLRRRWLLAATLLFDAFHLLVFALFGLIFWKWIALNLIITGAIALTPDWAWSRSARAVCVGFVLAGMLFFKTATLAWYDAPGFASVFFEAETRDGRRLRAPNAFFDMASYQVSQGRLYFPADGGHFRGNIWGSVLHWEELQAARACRPPAAPGPELYGPLERVGAYVAAQHEAALQRPSGFDYRWRLHHHMPNPWLPDAFRRLDKREVRAYYFVVESVCLRLEEGRLQRRVLRRSEYRVHEVQP